ncbi:MAG: class I SAM-dependent methyltransferase [Candidatus Hermodarchaeota archaeon]
MKKNNTYKFNVKTNRPEEIYEKASDYFKGDVLINYAKSKSLMRIQEKITARAIELLDLKEKDILILDAGSGPGFTSIYLKELGYHVVALDIIKQFLTFYNINELNPIAADMCAIPFKPNSFNAIISISALQWIFRDLHDDFMYTNLLKLVRSIEMVLKPKASAIFQFYPKNNVIMEEIGKIFYDNSHLRGNFIIDNPENVKKRKIFLKLSKK